MGGNNSTLSNMSNYMLSSIKIEQNSTKITNKNGEFQYFSCVLDFEITKNDKKFEAFFKDINISNKITPAVIYIAKQPNLNVTNIWDMVLKQLVYRYKSDIYDLGNLNQEQIEMVENEIVKESNWRISPFEGDVILTTVIRKMRHNG